MAFASGKYSNALCDYCGQRYPYNTLRKNWRGFMVCPDDYEPTPGFTAFQSYGSVLGTANMRPYVQDQALIAQGVVGKVTVSIT